MGLKERTSQTLLIFAIIQVLLLSTTHAAPKSDSESFEAQLFSKLVDANSDKNIFYSPLSIKMCLAMIRQGVSGETGQEIDEALASSGQGQEKLVEEYHEVLQKDRNNQIFKIASKIYVMSGYKVQRSFHTSLTQKFFSSIASLNFNKNKASANAINRWVEQQSDVTNLISPNELSGDTRMIVVNAVHFKSQWASKFNPKQTSYMSFTLEDGTTFNVKMMLQTGKFKRASMHDVAASVFEMPLKDANLSMIIVYPRLNEKLSAVEEKFNSIPWSEVEKKFQLDDYDLRIPKFKFEFKTELTQPLTEMGVQRIFSNDIQLDKMLAKGGQAVSGLKVDKMVHKTFIEINEEGDTVPKPAGGNLMGINTFTVNRPFYFFIKDEMNNKIFEGRINKKFSS